MHQDCALLKPKTATGSSRTSGAAETRGRRRACQATASVLREIPGADCDAEYVRELLETTDAEQAEWWAYCDATQLR
mgnify:CR=1 FL=1